jgi:uncharacterized protein
MSRLIAALAATFFLAQPLQAQCVGENLLEKLPAAERAALDARTAQVPYPQGNYWRATKDGQTVTIIGTYHLDDPRHATARAVIAPAISAARTVLVEAGPEEEAQLLARIAKDPSVMMITEGPTLLEQMPPEDWDRLAAAMSERQIPAFMAAKFKPWYVTIMLSIPPCSIAELANANGLDASVIAAAEEQNIPVRALEPYDTIFTIFGGMPDIDQIEMIMTTLAMEDRAVDMSITLADAYFAQDNRVIWEFMKDQALDLPGYPRAGRGRVRPDGRGFDIIAQSQVDTGDRGYRQRRPGLCRLRRAASVRPRRCSGLAGTRRLAIGTLAAVIPPNGLT